MERRTFLKGSMAAAAAAAASRLWLPAERLGIADEGGALIELTSRPLNYESVRSTFTTRVTPVERFYLRNHFDAPVVDVAAWRLRVRGLCEQPLELSLAELERMPQTTIEAVLQCAGNGRGLFRPRVPGVQWKWGAMGNAEWTGVRLRDVLARARPKDGVKHVGLQGAERPTLPQTPPFVRAISAEKALHQDTLIALKMNGHPLAPLRGAPARLVVPGWVADDWTRWISDVELRAEEQKGFWYETAYRFPEKPGAPGAPVPPAEMRPMTTLNVKSILGSLEPGQVLRRGTHELVGVAFSGGAGVGKVEISTDGARTWKVAKLEGPATPYGFRVFRQAWNASTPGKYRVAVRATDGAGRQQPETPVWNPGGYLYNAFETVDVEVRA